MKFGRVSRPGVRGVVRVCASLWLTFLAGLGLTTCAQAYTFGSTIKPLGPEETVFDWSTQKCEDLNIPDSPARAFRDSANQVHLTLSHYVNRQMTGSSLNSLTVSCNVTMSSHLTPDPSAYDDHEWIHSPFTFDGNKVYALVHNEYQGYLYPGECSTQGSFDVHCWYNSITLATSTDSGTTYTHAQAPTHLVASAPYQYVPDTGPLGLFTPSNIIARRTDNYLYVLTHVEPYGAQQVGSCLIRTRTLNDPTSWRAWNGAGFTVQFINPYINPDPPEKHVCQPVSYDQISTMSQSLTYSSFFGKWLLVGTSSMYDPGTGDTIYGFFYSTSVDLITWSQRQVLIEGVLPQVYQCGDEDPILYPALLDPRATTRNFSTTGQKAYIYFTKFHYVNCEQTLDRDLVRVPIQFLGPTVTNPPEPPPSY